MNRNHPVMITVIPSGGRVEDWISPASAILLLFAYQKTASNNWPVVISDRYTTAAAAWQKGGGKPKLWRESLRPDA